MRFVCTCIVVLALFSSALAQPPAKAASDQTQKPDQSQKKETSENPGIETYRFHIVIYELEDGKRTNQREYSMVARTFERSSTRLGSRIPVSLEEKKIEYMDVGLSLSCSLRSQNGKTLADFSVSITSLVPPDLTTAAHVASMPVLRNFSENVSMVVTTEKPFLLASSDDLNSKRRTQVEVTATRLD